MTAGRSLPSDDAVGEAATHGCPPLAIRGPAFPDPRLGAASAIEIDRVVSTKAKHHASEIR